MSKITNDVLTVAIKWLNAGRSIRRRLVHTSHIDMTVHCGQLALMWRGRCEVETNLLWVPVVVVLMLLVWEWLLWWLTAEEDELQWEADCVSTHPAGDSWSAAQVRQGCIFTFIQYS